VSVVRRAQNLPSDLTEEELRDLFAPYGNVVECRVLHSGTARADSGMGAGALVRMSAVEEAAAAIAHLHNSRLDGVGLPLIVRFADSQEQKAKKAARQQKREVLSHCGGGRYAMQQQHEQQHYHLHSPQHALHALHLQQQQHYGSGGPPAHYDNSNSSYGSHHSPQHPLSSHGGYYSPLHPSHAGTGVQPVQLTMLGRAASLPAWPGSLVTVDGWRAATSPLPDLATRPDRAAASVCAPALYCRVCVARRPKHAAHVDERQQLQRVRQEPARAGGGSRGAAADWHSGPRLALPAGPAASRQALTLCSCLPACPLCRCRPAHPPAGTDGPAVDV
jgi:hypothetical protein